jgi:hypothetical protein
MITPVIVPPIRKGICLLIADLTPGLKACMFHKYVKVLLRTMYTTAAT